MSDESPPSPPPPSPAVDAAEAEKSQTAEQAVEVAKSAITDIQQPPEQEAGPGGGEEKGEGKEPEGEEEGETDELRKATLDKLEKASEDSLLGQDVVCEECGDVGVKDLLLHCSNCNASRHRYCLDQVIYDSSIVEWLCNDCPRKHNEAIKSLDDLSNQMQPRNTQLDSSIINESNAKKEKVTKELCVGREVRNNATKYFPNGDTFNWEHLINSSHKARRDSSDASPEQLHSGEALNCHHILIGELSKCNDGEKKWEHLICALGSVDGTSKSALDHASEIEEDTNFQKRMDGFEPTLNFMECPGLSKENDSSSLKYVKGSIPQERNGNLVSIINDVERSSPMMAEKSRPTLACEEQADGSSPALAIVEEARALNVVKGLIYKQESVVASKFPSNHSNPMQGSNQKIGNVDVLNHSKACLDSWLKVAELSQLSNEREDSTFEKDNAEKTKCLADEEIVTPTLENCKGSDLSMTIECLVSNEGSSDAANKKLDELLLSTKDKKMRKHKSGEVHCTCDDPSERANPCKVNKISNPKSAEDQDGKKSKNLKYNARRTSSPVGKKVVNKQVLQVEAIKINSESLSSKYVTPCESTKINPRKRQKPDSYTPRETKYPKAKLIKKHTNVNVARSKSGRSAASTKDNQYMRGKDNHINDKVIEGSRLGKDKNMNKSWLANKTNSDLQKRAMVTSVLQPSSLHESSVDKSRKAAHEANNAEPKKRRRLILPYDEDEDAETMQVEDLNPLRDNNGQVKKQSRYMDNGVKNQRRYEGKSEEALQPGNLSDLYSKNHKQVKKQRSLKANEDENTVAGDLNAGCTQNDVSQLALRTVVTEDHGGLSRMPLISEHICMQPADKPCWTGIMKIGRDYIPLAAHLSTKAGKKVHELSRSLPPIIKVAELSTSKSPKRLEAPKPTADSIGLYFFSGDTRLNKELDQLVKHVADSSIVLETVVGLAKLLLFPSVVLPDEYQMSQGKHYLWGVFQPRKDKRRRLAPAEQDCTVHVMKEKQVQEQHVLDQPPKAPCRDNRVQEQPLPSLDANRDLGKESVSGNVRPCARAKALVSANVSPADDGQPCSNSEAPPLKLCGFVVARTPRAAQLIQEMQKEGARLFSVQQVLTEPVSMV